MRKVSTFGLFVLLLLIQPGWLASALGDLKNHSALHPKIVMIIRHAEKPDGAEDGKDPDLSSRGFERAAALAKVIPEHFPKPDFLIATKKSAHSNRPYETIEPLSKALHITIESKFKDEDFASVAHELLDDPKYAGKTVLIAWHHGKIPELARALGATDAPDKWDGKVFDRVWEITFDKDKETMTNLPEKALPGDSDK
jgi:broad specificity phosphatase PhoE